MTNEPVFIDDDKVEVLDGPTLPVIFHESPFASRVRFAEVVEGNTLATTVAAAKLNIPNDYWPFIRVWVNDLEVPRERWGEVRVVAGQNVYVRVVPQKSFKDIFRFIAMIAIAVVSVATGQLWGLEVGKALGIGATWGAAVVSVGVMAVGYLLVNAIAPPPKLNMSGGQQDDQRFRLTGSSNAFQPYGNIPRVFGKRRVFPMMAARPYSEVQGDDEYLRMCLCVGWGPLKIENIKIGETPITSFEGVEIETREGWAGDAPLTLFTRTVNEETFQVALEPAGTTGYYNYSRPGFDATYGIYDVNTGSYITYSPASLPSTNTYSVRTTALNSVEFSVDIAFPAGLYKFDSKNAKVSHSVTVSVQYRQVGTTTWINAAWQNSFEDGFGTPGQIVITASDSSAVRRSGRVKLPAAGQYEVRVRRETGGGDDKTVDLTYWSALRSIRAGYPVQQSGLALIALRIKASGQLNGVPNVINCEATSYLPEWNGTAWNWNLSRNPAWAYADLLRRRGPDTFLADSRLDLTAIKAWGDACAATAPNASEPRWTFDMVLEGGSVHESLKIVASHGRASFTVKDGKYSVVRDAAQSTPIQHITPRNSWGYTGNKAFIDYPHAMRVVFPNAAKGYEEDERIVYDDGYTSANATKFETLELPGCTSATMAFREGRYHMATAKLRPEEHSVQMDIENLRCTVGDLVRFSHDAIGIGLQTTRVRSRVVNGSNQVTSITMDDDLLFEVGKSYVIRSRLSNGTTVLTSINNPGAGFASTVTPTTPPLSSAAPAPGDLVLFGEASLESAEMIIKRIEASEDFTATVYMVDAAPAVHTSDTGTIPAFNSLITLAKANIDLPPPAFITAVRSDDGAVQVNPDGTLTYSIIVQVQPPQSSTDRADYVEVRWRATTSAGVWKVETLERGQSSLTIAPVQVGASYTLQSRSVAADGQPSEWSTAITHTVQGRLAAPSSITGLTATAIAGGISLTWTNPQDYDYWRAEVYENTVNNSATATLIGYSTGTRYDRLGISAADGLRFYWLKAVNTSGRATSFTSVVSATALNRALIANINNEAVTLPAAADGAVASFADATGYFQVFDGPTDVTASATIAAVASSGLTGTVNTAANIPVAGQPKGYYRVTALTANAGFLTITATYNGGTVERIFSVAKAFSGLNGANAVEVSITRSAMQVFAFADGSVASYNGVDGQMTVRSGSTDLMSSATLSSTAGAGVTGAINTADNTPYAGQPKGYYRITDMTGDTGTLTLNAVVGGVTYTRTFSLSKVKGGYEIVSALPTTNLFAGRVVFLTTDGKLYRYNAGSWTPSVPAGDITGQIIASQIAANAVTTDKLDAGAVTAAKINVSQLSALTANLGTLTAGLIRNTGDTFRVDVSNGRTIVQVGSYMKVTGAQFGSTSQFIEWYGPYFADLANCTEANAIYYLKTNGSAYFGGTLNAGILRNSAQTTDLTSTASVLVGPFTTNGGTKTITVSYDYLYTYRCNSSTGSISGTTTISIVLEKSTDGGTTWSTVTTLNPTEQQRTVVVDGEPGIPDRVTYRAAGSTTATDNTAAGTMRLRARLTTRTLPSFGGSGIFSITETQNISVVSTE